MFKKDLIEYLKTHVADDEPVFLLRAQDTTAPGHVRHWAVKAMDLSAPPQKTGEAMECAHAMDRWQDENRHLVKVPD